MCIKNFAPKRNFDRSTSSDTKDIQIMHQRMRKILRYTRLTMKTHARFYLRVASKKHKLSVLRTIKKPDHVSVYGLHVIKITSMKSLNYKCDKEKPPWPQPAITLFANSYFIVLNKSALQVKVKMPTCIGSITKVSLSQTTVTYSPRAVFIRGEIYSSGIKLKGISLLKHKKGPNCK